jgi:hypothetical protein
MKTLFEPHLVLNREPDGEYTLHAVTITPNSSYLAGPAECGVPPNVRLLPEVQPVLLRVHSRKGPALQVLTPVRHCLPDLRLGPAAGKTTLTAFVMLGESIVGSASIDTSQLGKIGVGPGKDKPAPLDTSDWYAWVNRMPPGPATFHVQGVVTMGHPGYRVALAPAAPQGINPAELILDLRIEKRPGAWPRVVSRLPVSYEIQQYTGAYKTVLIRLPDGGAEQVQVEEVF